MRSFHANTPTAPWGAAVSSAALLASAAAQAHHSFSMFDFDHERTLTGTVKEIQWTNPHCFIQLMVPEGGAMREWSIEMGSPIHLLRHGWDPNLVKPGEQLTVVIHPMRDGSHGGDYVRASRAGGDRVGS